MANRDNVDDFATKSQMQTYEGVRAMYEAYSRNKYQATGVIQWMLNNAWPSMIWHLYDYYLRPGGGYFGAKRAMEALHPDLRLRRSFHLGGQQPVRRRQRTEAHHEDLQPRHDGKVHARRIQSTPGADSTAKIFASAGRGGAEPHLFPRAAAARFSRKTRRLEFLLALHQTGNSRLGEVATGG